MLKEEKLVLKNIGKDKFFNRTIQKLFTDKQLSFSEKTYILACAILFLNYYQKDNRLTSYADFAYFIILKYSLFYDDYNPLYDFSTNFGFYPIAKAILNKQLLNSFNIGNIFINSELDRFKNDKGYFETLEQHTKSKDFLDDESGEKSYQAPTSFGKSSIIVDYIGKIIEQKLKIVIIVPTKSLLVQTHKMIREAGFQSRIITHDEMYNRETTFIAIFTQERALRLLNRNSGIYFDILFIDEAHNILKKDSRSVLLSRLIAKNRSANPQQKVVYLSPLIENIQNIKNIKEQEINSHNINFNIKEPEIFEYRLNKKIVIYNRFNDQFYDMGEDSSMFIYLKNNSQSKNFLYNYSPVKIELLASELCAQLPNIVLSESMLELEDILKKEVHKDFYGVKYLKFGMVYLHGKLPDLIKEYLESKFKNLPELKYIIANSVILEGMNLPIDSLFIFNTRALNGKELMNLIGRVNRLNKIFFSNEENLKKLLPKVHFINSEKYNRLDSKMENKIKLLRSRIFEDCVENPVLNSFDFEKLGVNKDQEERVKKDVKRIQDNENFLYTPALSKRDALKKYLIEAGITNFYNNADLLIDRFMLKSESIKNNLLLEWKNIRMLEKIEYLFIRDIVNTISDFEFKRLESLEARSYYENYILISKKKSLNVNINSQYEYFIEKIKSSETKLYTGDTYGEESYDSGVYPQSKRKVYTDLSKKTPIELINLAIVKLKMEEDFVSFKLNKFIVMLYDYELISKDEYNTYIYGTNDEKKIALTKYGFSISLTSRLEKDGQLSNLTFDENNNLKGNSNFQVFRKTVDDFYNFEISRYLD